MVVCEAGGGGAGAGGVGGGSGCSAVGGWAAGWFAVASVGIGPEEAAGHAAALDMVTGMAEWEGEGDCDCAGRSQGLSGSAVGSSAGRSASGGGGTGVIAAAWRIA